jgi:hypothetical protein
VKLFFWAIYSPYTMSNFLNRNKSRKKKTKKIKHKHVCPRCKDPFYTKKELTVHMNKVTECPKRSVSPKILEPCECECGALLSCPFSLKRHMETCPYMQRQKDTTVVIGGNISDEIIDSILQYIIVPYTQIHNIYTFSLEDFTMLINPKNNPYLVLFKTNHCSETKAYYHNIYYPPGQTQDVFVYTTGLIWKKLPIRKVFNEVLLIHRKELLILRNLLPYNNDENLKKIRDSISNYIDLVDPLQLTLENVGKYDDFILELYEDMRKLLRSHEGEIFNTFTKTTSEIKSQPIYKKSLQKPYIESYDDSSTSSSNNSSDNLSTSSSGDENEQSSDISVSDCSFDSSDDFCNTPRRKK